MEAYTMDAAEVEITPADRIEAARLLNDGREFHTDESTPVDALVEPNPRDDWPAWTDEDTWELGPEPDEWFDALYAARVEAGELTDFDCCPGFIG